LIGNLLRDDPDRLVHTLNVLGETGDESAIVPIRELLHHEPKDANVRFAADVAASMQSCTNLSRPKIWATRRLNWGTCLQRC
jgi:hypothetical protein